MRSLPPPATPDPLHGEHGSRQEYVTCFEVPRAASIKEMGRCKGILISVSPPKNSANGEEPRVAELEPNMVLNISAGSK